MSEIIGIVNGTTYMEIVIDAFFPTSEKRIDKLVNCIKKDEEHRDFLLSNLLFKMQNLIDWKQQENREDETRLGTCDLEIAEYRNAMLTGGKDAAYKTYMREQQRRVRERKKDITSRIRNRNRDCTKVSSNIEYVKSVAIW